MDDRIPRDASNHASVPWPPVPVRAGRRFITPGVVDQRPPAGDHPLDQVRVGRGLLPSHPQRGGRVPLGPRIEDVPAVADTGLGQRDLPPLGRSRPDDGSIAGTVVEGEWWHWMPAPIDHGRPGHYRD